MSIPGIVNSKSMNSFSRGSTSGSVKSRGIRTATADTSSFDEITAEEKMKMMLGHIVTGKNCEPIYFREDFCGVCGIQHSNPKFLDMVSN